MTRSLVSLVGHSWARRMLLDAEMVTVDDLVACGAWSWVCSAADFDDQLNTWTKRLASLSPYTQAGSKNVLAALSAPSPESSEYAAHWVDAAYQSADFAAAVDSFSRKTPATFSEHWPSH